MFSERLEKIVGGHDLSTAEMAEVMDQVMEGQLTPAQIGALITALRMKKESVAEISAAALSMRRHATVVEPGAPPIVDTCGTGGDGSGTFNISTTAAFIAAGAGVKIAKHGNKSVSSKCGSADVLAELGVNIEVNPEKVGESIQSVGIGFLFAPLLHGAMKHAIGPRRELGIRTIFNMLGPLTNPARATAQVLGVFDAGLTEIFAAVLKQMGSDRAMVVHGADHLDEITVTGTTQISELVNGEIKTREFDPLPFIGGYAQPQDLAGGEPTVNAAITRSILAGEDGPKTEAAVLNAAAAITVAAAAADFADAVDKARESLTSGSAARKLEDLIAFSND